MEATARGIGREDGRERLVATMAATVCTYCMGDGRGWGGRTSSSLDSGRRSASV